MNSRVINLDALHMDVLLNRFNAQLPAIFHTMDEEKENRPEGKKNKRQKSKESKDGNRGDGNKKLNAIANIDQIPEFMMPEGKS
jgi:hypothetical protein